jgi:hypothetical protein
MPDDFDDTNEDQPDEGEERDNHDIRQLREKAKRADELETRLTAMERENTFAKALGDRLTDPKMRYFQQGYDGELTVEAVREAAKRDGFWAEPGTPPTADLDAAGRMAAASSGAGTPAPTNVLDAISQAKTAEEVMAIVESEQAAAAGLRSVRQNQ